MSSLIEFINSHWDDCIKENRQDEENGSLLGMPYPYTVPAVGHFDEMYYWDTYFTNVGLIISDRASQAKYNTDNMLYMISRYGYMPNGNRTFYLSHSQPPFLSMMVYDIYRYYGDKAWLRGAYEALLTEYDFWMTKRITPAGLNCYGDDSDRERLIEHSYHLERRMGIDLSAYDREKLGLHYFVMCESGWDINTRFGLEGYNFAPVDLNSLMYGFEKNMEYFSLELGLDCASKWAGAAEKRRALMLSLMDNGEGLLLDYNFVTGKLSENFSAASLYPLFLGVADKKNSEAVMKNLPRLEAEYGILANEKNDTEGSFQWGYPNGWACHQYIAYMGLDFYGYKKDARRLAEKFVSATDKIFSETGNLWEKYNVLEGSCNVADEYKMPAMMGWSAGAYLAARKYLED
ncbi:MAG: alpha,alpha-trehalase [Clostridia bacterium]|nr:alpha,alpha-trehalase [Clostridia bacterium]